MLSKKVIATQITNLTDARYFAARGVDYLLFDMSITSIEKALEIKEWVEGPDILLLFNVDSLDLLDEAIIKISPKAIAGFDKSTAKELMHLAAHVEIFEWQDSDITLGDMDFKRASKVLDLESLNTSDGLIITGSMEEEVGIKAFDDLDELLDALEEV